MLDIAKVVVTDAEIVVVDAAPDVTGLTATPQRRAVSFTWDGGSISPYHFEYQTQVESAGWVPATPARIDGNFFRQELTDVEQADGALTIAMRVRTSNGLGDDGDWAEISEDVLPLDAGSGDALSDIDATMLADSLLARIFDTAAKDSDELTEGATNLFAAESGADITANHTAADTTLVSGVAALTVKNGAADGATAQTKITSEVGANTIETTAGSQSKVDSRLSSAEKSNLITALGVALTALDVSAPIDRILIAQGSNKNLASLATTVKTDLSLDAVENKTAAQIIAAALNDTALGAYTTAVLAAAIVTVLNAQQVATLIDHIFKVSKGKDDTGATAVFNSSGNLLTGIFSGATTITAANMIAAISTAGRAKNLDLTSIGAGTLDNIPDGTTYKLVPANSKLGADYAYIGLNSSGELTVGTINKTVAELEGIHTSSLVQAAAHVYSSGVSDFTEYTVTTVDAATFVRCRMFKLRRGTGKNKVRFNCLAYSQAGAGSIRADLYSFQSPPAALSTPINTSTTIPLVATYAAKDLVLTFDSQIAEEAEFVLLISLADTNGVTVKFKAEDVRQTAA